MKQGKKSTAEHIFYDAMDIIAEKTNEEPLKVFKKAVDNVKPVRRGQVAAGRRLDLPGAGRRAARSGASRWRCAGSPTTPASARTETMAEKFAAELIDAFRSTGTAVKKREDTHKMAEANKAFAHYRW